MAKEKIKICILESSVLTTRWENNFCIPQLQDRYDISYWDCTDIVKPAFCPQHRLERNYVVKIHSINELSAQLGRLPADTLLVVNIHENPHNYRFYKTVAAHFKTIIRINFFAQNIVRVPIPTWKRLIGKLHPRRMRQIYYWKRYARMMNKVVISCTPDTIRYRINHPDYEAYRKALDMPPVAGLENENYVVYLDNYFPYHPEIKMHDSHFVPQRIAQSFFDSMNHFFDQVEKKYHCKVVIAAHPSADFDPNPYNGRDIIFNQTNVLVRHAMGVFMHMSNTIGFVQMNNKPVSCLTNAAFENAEKLYKYMEHLAQKNHIHIIDTDHYDTSQEAFYPIDEQVRNDYIAYQTDGKAETNAQRLSTYFEEIYNRLKTDGQV